MCSDSASRVSLFFLLILIVAVYPTILVSISTALGWALTHIVVEVIRIRANRSIKDAINDRVPVPSNCSADQIIKYDGDGWVCADMPAGGGGASPELVVAETGSDLTNVIALCPSGKKVTGGGCRFNMVNTAQQLKYCEFIESYPLNDLSGYGCFAEPTPSGPGLCQVTDAYAICQ